MERGSPHLIPPRELDQVLEHLDDPRSGGVLLLGEAGTGKTALLNMVYEALAHRGRAVFRVGLGSLREAGELGAAVLDAVAASRYMSSVANVERTLRSSSRDVPLSESASILHLANLRLWRPVLLLDALDEVPYPGRMLSGIEELSIELTDWKLVVASRETTLGDLRYRPRLSRFHVMTVGGLTPSAAGELLHSYAPSLPGDVVSRIVQFTGGNPLLLHVVGQQLEQRSASWAASVGEASTTEHALEWLVNEAVSASPEPKKLGDLLDELAKSGRGLFVEDLAARANLAEDDVKRLLDAPRARALVALDGRLRYAELLHPMLRDVILTRRVHTVPFRISDLKFGAEEAERDELLDFSYVQRPGTEAILEEKRTIVVGDRGSGKSAIFRKLTAGTTAATSSTRADIHPVTNTGDLLHKIVDDDAWLDTDKLRAAWLVVVASVVADSLPGSAPRQLKRDAAALRAALGFSMAPVTQVKRALRAVARVLGGTTLKFTVGPAELDVQLPSGSVRPGKSSLRVEEFLRETSRLLAQFGREAVVMFDQIDETFKYDRAKQQAVVQALLQAEARVSLLDCVRLIVFLRTDLFELYDIQEKNKLVSRTLTLDWEEEEWLQVLVRRVLVNEPLQRLARRLGVADNTADVRAALEVLFPPELEGQPVDRWLIDSLRNGNGDVSPRSAILLLYLARERAARPNAVVSTLPLFSAAEAGEAMTRLSDLSFSEVVNDFKVAPSFVQNCRAAKLETFALADVRDLFDEDEGKVSDQVRLLERLGFLERIVRERVTATGAIRESMFRIPRLYTRCWDHA